MKFMRILALLLFIVSIAMPAGAGFSNNSIGQPPPDDTAYDSTSWNGSLRSASKNALRDKIETMSGGGVNITIPDGGTIGSTTTPGAISISSGGDITLTQDIIMGSGKTIGITTDLDLVTLTADTVTIAGAVAATNFDGIVGANVPAAGTFTDLIATSLATSYSHTKTVAASGGDYTSLSTAVTAATAGDTILLFPGTYTETLTVAVNNLTIMGMGSPFNTTLTQADANIIDFGATIGGRIENVSITLSAATTAIAAVQGSTGTFIVKNCKSTLVSAAALNQADQPRIGELSGAGTLKFALGRTSYTHTGACTTATAIKAPFEVAAGGKISVFNQHLIEVTGGGSALATALGLTVGTGHLVVDYNDITIDDDTATNTVGLGYLSSATSVDNEFSFNQIHVHAAANNAYGVFAINATLRSSHNHLHVECSGGGTAYSFAESGTGEINSHMDDIIATGGYSGNVNIVSSDADGDLAVSGDMSTATLAVSAAASLSSVTATTGTFSGDIVTTEDVKIGDGKYIGSTSDPDAIAISSGGDVTLTQDIVMASGNLIGIGTDLDLVTLTADTFTVAGAVAATTVSATGVITSTQATGTSPFTIASTTVNTNLNADKLDGADWAAPAAIGSGTPAAGTFTTLAASGASSLSVVTASTVTATTFVLDDSLAADGDYSGTACAGTIGYTSASFGDLVYLANGDDRWEKTDADAEATAGDVMLALVVSSGSSDGDACVLLLSGFMREDDWDYTSGGDALYISVTEGTMSSSRPVGNADIVRVVGYAGQNADTVYFNPSGSWVEIVI